VVRDVVLAAERDRDGVRAADRDPQAVLGADDEASGVRVPVYVSGRQAMCAAMTASSASDAEC
jgi:hypothetical protein